MAFKSNDKKSTKQQENTYIVYMMLGSFFNKTICRTKYVEKVLYLYYKELSADKQVSRETDILKELDKHFEAHAELLETMECEVYFQKVGADYEVLFFADEVEIKVVVDSKGMYNITSNLKNEEE